MLIALLLEITFYIIIFVAVLGLFVGIALIVGFPFYWFNEILLPRLLSFIGSRKLSHR